MMRMQSRTKQPPTACAPATLQPPLPPQVALTRKDEYGRILTPKEAFRQLCYRFHGIQPSKGTQEKRRRQARAGRGGGRGGGRGCRRRAAPGSEAAGPAAAAPTPALRPPTPPRPQIEEQLQQKRVATGAGEAETVSHMKDVQRKAATPYVVLSGTIKPGQVRGACVRAPGVCVLGGCGVPKGCGEGGGSRGGRQWQQLGHVGKRDACVDCGVVLMPPSLPEPRRRQRLRHGGPC